LQHTIENATPDLIPVCYRCLCFSSSTNLQTAGNRSGRTSSSGGNWPHYVGKVVHRLPERVPCWQLGSRDEGTLCCILSSFANFVRCMRSFNKHLPCQLTNEQRWPSSTLNNSKLEENCFIASMRYTEKWIFRQHSGLQPARREEGYQDSLGYHIRSTGQGAGHIDCTACIFTVDDVSQSKISG